MSVKTAGRESRVPLNWVSLGSLLSGCGGGFCAVVAISLPLALLGGGGLLT